MQGAMARKQKKLSRDENEARDLIIHYSFQLC